MLAYTATVIFKKNGGVANASIRLGKTAILPRSLIFELKQQREYQKVAKNEVAPKASNCALERKMFGLPIAMKYHKPQIQKCLITKKTPMLTTFRYFGGGPTPPGGDNPSQSADFVQRWGITIGVLTALFWAFIFIVRQAVRSETDNFGQRICNRISESEQRINNSLSESEQRISNSLSEFGQRINNSLSEFDQRLNEVNNTLKRLTDSLSALNDLIERPHE